MIYHLVEVVAYTKRSFLARGNHSQNRRGGSYFSVQKWVFEGLGQRIGTELDLVNLWVDRVDDGA